MSWEYAEEADAAEAEAEHLVRLRREIEKLRRRIYRYKMAGAALLALGVYFLFLALLLITRSPSLPWSVDVVYVILAAAGSICFAIGLYLFSA